MTDQAPSPVKGSFVTEEALARLKKRRRADRRFRSYGLAAIGFAMAALVLLVVSIGSQAMSAVTKHHLTFEMTLDPDVIAPNGKDSPREISKNVEGFYALVRKDLETTFPEVGRDRAARQDLFGLMTRLAVLPMAEATARHPSRLGHTYTYSGALSDDLDLYLKGAVSPERRVSGLEVRSVGNDGALLGEFKPLMTALAGIDFEKDRRSILLMSQGNIGRLTGLNDASAQIKMLTGEAAEFAGERVQAQIIALPESERNVSDRQIAWTLALQDAGRIKRRLNTDLLTTADSTYPELAGTLAAIVGSLLTMFVTAALAIPVGIFASIYLEEFAPRNRLTSIIEVNINNLAAVPSIVFGLLGAAVFLVGIHIPLPFALPLVGDELVIGGGMGRSWPLVGGLVLGLLTLPTIIIASRAALQSVPPSIRSAALGVGASKTQSVFHHVLPMAWPGILTGSIIGMARALGETAPLLLIGMVAFVAEVPTGPTDESTVLPVLVYTWATNAERAWQPMTAAAIVVLLTFMVLMNAIAVFLRRKLERRW